MRGLRFDKKLAAKQEFAVRYDATSDIEYFWAKPKRGRKVPNEPTAIYPARLPISKKKYTDLVNYCMNGAIPTHYHHEFIDLPNSETVRDALNEADEDEGAIEEENL